MAEWHVRGQVAAEFMVLVGVLIFVFTLILGIIAGEAYNINKEKTDQLGNDIAAKAQKEISLAARVSDGYSRVFILPGKIGNKDYSISTSEGRVVVSIEGYDFWRTIPSVQGNIKKGNNIINKTNGV